MQATRSLAVCAALACAFFALPAVSSAAEQTWPTKPVRVVVPFAAGGGTDSIARALGQKLAETLASNSSSITAPAQAGR